MKFIVCVTSLCDTNNLVLHKEDRGDMKKKEQ